MKKVVSVLLALTLMLSLSVSAMAAGKSDKATKDDKVNTSSGQRDPITDEEAISEADAQNIALTDAGLTQSELKSIHVYKEYSYGRAYAYRVEFGVYNREVSRNTVVYSYEIDLYTGVILDSTVR